MFFSNNRLGNLSDYTVEAAVGYDKDLAIYDVMVESIANQEKMFSAAVYCDLQEASMIHEGAAVEDIEAFQEASVSGFFAKIKEFVKKLWAKIKAVFHGFIAKLNSYFMKSDKEFASKYKKELDKKDLSKFKIKIQKPTAKYLQASISLVAITGTNMSDDTSDADLEDKYLNQMFGSDVSRDSAEKDIHELWFEDEDEKEGGETVRVALNDLSTKKEVKDMEKKQSDMDKMFKRLLSDIDKAAKSGNKAAIRGFNSDDTSSGTVSSNASKDKDKTNANNANLRRKVKAIQKVVNIYTAACIREAKFKVAQDRRIVAKAVAFNPDKHMNESALYDFLAEAAEWEAITDLR